jgi:hypothetical protein
VYEYDGDGFINHELLSAEWPLVLMIKWQCNDVICSCVSGILNSTEQRTLDTRDANKYEVLVILCFVDATCKFSGLPI